MNNQTMRLAVAAGFLDGDLELFPETIERFAELVRQDAMEEAAKICDELNYNGMNSLHCAQAIRNRAEE
jgi:cytosine/adenosine deaminase-related metal-dependent hydrolase